MKRLSGFSLMEMMVVLLIVSIIAAASAPMVNRKMVADAVGGCKWGEGNNIIFYNGNRENRAVAIGTNDAPTNRPRLHIASDNTLYPHIRLTDNTDLAAPTAVNLHYANDSILLTDAAPTNSASSVVVGSGITAINSNNSVVIGNNAASNCDAGTGTAAPGNTVVIGNNASATALKSVAIGNNADVHTVYSIAIGSEAKILTVPGADGTDNIWSNLSSIAIGNSAEIRGGNSIAIGNRAMAVGPYDNETKEFLYSDNNIAIGQSRAYGPHSIALGGSALSTVLETETEEGSNEKYSGHDTAVGWLASSEGYECTALGYGARAGSHTGSGDTVRYLGHGATAVGANSTASGDYSIAAGYNSNADEMAVAIGFGATASNSTVNSETVSSGVAVGTATARGQAVAVGDGAEAQFRSIALGAASSAKVRGDSYGTSIGASSNAYLGGISIGTNSAATGANSIAIGGNGKLGLNTPTTTYWVCEEATSHLPGRSAKNWVSKKYSEEPSSPKKGAITAKYRYDNNAKFRRYANNNWKSTIKKIINGYDIAWVNYVAKYPDRGSDVFLRSTPKQMTDPEVNAEGEDVLEGATASGISSIAIGIGTEAAHTNSVALGTNAQTTAANQIVLGTADTTVYIPGNLVVGKHAVLGLDSGYMAIIRAHKLSSSDNKLIRLRYDGANIEVSGAGYDKDHSSGLSEIYPESDRRLKNVGEAFKAGLEEIKKLELFHYTYKKDESKTPHVGVMAQDLMKIFPDAVWKGEDGFYRIRMEDMFYALVNAVKELDAKIEALKNNEIAELRKENKEMHKLIEALQKQNEKIVEQNEKLEKRINALEKKVK